MRRKIYATLCLLIIVAVVYLIIPPSTCAHTQPYISNKTTIYNTASMGILIINSGTPSSLTKGEVGCFIGDMLSDPYVMGMPEWVRTTLARKIIAPLRSSASLEKYSLIWGDPGNQSPLLINTTALADSIEQSLSVPVEIAMRYGTPTIEQAVTALERRCNDMKEVLLLPLFPQYAESSYLSAVEAVKKSPSFAVERYKLRIVEPYYNNPSYISSLADRISTKLKGDTNYHLVFSYHSLPLSHIEVGKLKGERFDYEFQCRQTAKLVAQVLGISDYSVVYASAMGRRWQGPLLDEVMAQFPAKGIKRVAVIAPGFIIDNLETLYDIDINARKIFKDNAGESMLFIPCLNDQFSSAAIQIVNETFSRP